MTKRYDVLIVGAGQGGAQVAMALRQQDHPGTIGLIGDEAELPYDRPPLSKEYLSGEKPWERLIFRTAEAWAGQRVDLLLGQRVVTVDAEAHVVTTVDGEAIGYQTLIWATGGSPRRLACDGHDLIGVHSVRNRTDVDRLMAELPSVQRVVVIGGGYIGLEAAAVLIKLGKRVILLEALDRLLARVAGEPLSRFYEAEHREHGVDVRLEAKVDCLVGEGGRVTGVRLSDGEILAAHMVIVGIGIVPAVEPLLAAGADGGNGVRVDGQCRTSLPDIYAIGDCAEHRNPHAGHAWIRLESVQNANDQAATVASAVMGGSAEYTALPWFWSNQYDLKLQTAGLSLNHDDVVVRGKPATRSFSVIYLREGRVIALDCINNVRDYTHGRALIANGAKPDRQQLEDLATPLKAHL